MMSDPNPLSPDGGFIYAQVWMFCFPHSGHFLALRHEKCSLPLFAFESRGKIEAKGKGEISMYFVTKN